MEKNFVPNPQWMSEKYDEMNAMLFNGRLGSCGFNIFTTGKGSGGSVLGWFKITGHGIKIDRRTRKMFFENYWDREYINKDNFVDLCKPVIELNGNYHGTEHGFLSTLVHEMCHYYTYMEGWAPTQAHGREFRNIGSVVASRSNGMFTVQRIATALKIKIFSVLFFIKNRAKLLNSAHIIPTFSFFVVTNPFSIGFCLSSIGVIFGSKSF